MPAPPVPWRPSSPCASSSGCLALKDAAFPTVLIKLRAGDLGQGLERLVEIGDELTILASEKCRGRGAFSRGRQIIWEPKKFLQGAPPRLKDPNLWQGLSSVGSAVGRHWTVNGETAW